MLQIVFIAMFLGVGLIKVPNDKGKALKEFFESLNDVIIRLVDIIMLMAPYGVFALISQTINQVAGDNPSEILELSALGFYMVAVIIGLIVHALITYAGLLKTLTSMPLKMFYKGIALLNCSHFRLAQVVQRFQSQWNDVRMNLE